MYCVIQEIQLKKPNIYGAYKNLEAYSTDCWNSHIQKVMPKYAYQYTGDRFERPIKAAYKISIHESKRINGVVTKKQYVVTTIDYYSLTYPRISDCIISPTKKIQIIADNLNTAPAAIWNLIYNKVKPLQERIITEFEKTYEYKTKAKHDKIIRKYEREKAKFAKTHGCEEGEYDYVFNVFGELMNSDYHEMKSSYQKKSRSNYEKFDFNFGFGNFQNGDESGYNNLFSAPTEKYTDDEKTMLKNFYKTLSKLYHPDITNNDGQAMQLLNRLKESWGI